MRLMIIFIHKTARSTSIFGLSALSISFSYDEGGQTSSRTFELLAFTDSSGLNTQMNKLVSSSASNVTYPSQTGSVWLHLQYLEAQTAENTNAGDAGISSRSVMIVDLVSNTTVSVTAWQDGVDDDEKYYNHVYMINVIKNIVFLLGFRFFFET